MFVSGENYDEAVKRKGGVEKNPQLVAKNLLKRYKEKKYSLRKVIRDYLRKTKRSKGNALPSRQLRYAIFLVVEVVRHKNTVDFLLQFFTSSGRKISKDTRALMEIATYQISIAGEDVGKVMKESMRNINNDKLLWSFCGKYLLSIAKLNMKRRLFLVEDKKMRESVELNFPSWLIDIVKVDYGNEYRRIIRGLDKRPRNFIRFNSNLMTEDISRIVSEELKDKLIQLESTELPTVFEVTNGYWRILTENLNSRFNFEIQDKASVYTALQLIDDKKKEPGVLVDYCAAPGSKLLQFIEIMSNKSIIAIEINLERSNLLKERIATKGSIYQIRGNSIVSPIRPVVDKALVDPPCSSLGTISQHPDIKWRLTKKRMMKYVKTQKAILEEAVKLLKPEGSIIYSTCTICQKENIEVIKWILGEYESIETVRIEKSVQGRREIVFERKDIVLKSNNEQSQKLQYGYLLLSHESGTKGFFLCKLRKRG